MKVSVYKLATKVQDKATKTKGVLCSAVVYPDHVFYSMKPDFLDKNGDPAPTIGLTSDRISGGQEVEVDLPMEIIGSTATDTNNGYKGTITGLVIYMHGCLHAVLQASGVDSDNQVKKEIDVDLRLLKGPMIAQLTKEKLEESKKRYPSPNSFVRQQPR